MSELQLGLVVIAAVILVAVLAYNKYEQIRLRRRTQAAFGSAHPDVLLADAAPSTEAEGPGVSVDMRVEHTLGDYVTEKKPEVPSDPTGFIEPLSSRPQTVSLRYAALDARIDFVVGFDLPRPISGEDIAQHALAALDPGLRKPVHWEGYDSSAKSWLAIQPQHRYEQVRVGLQLVNRAGPVDEDEIAAFMSGLQELALALAAQLEVTDVDTAYEAALGLDAFCADHDIQIGLSVLGREGLTLAGTKIRALAESNGCVLAKDGRFHKLNEHGVSIYTLGNTEPMPFHPETLKSLSTRGVSLTLDVPRAPGIPNTFRNFIEFAKQLAQALDGVLVDDDRKALSDAAIEQIAVQLNVIHQAMAARGIPAGGPAALRLFV